MTVKYIRKDLLRVKPYEGIVVQQINAVGQVGGLTKALCSKFPDNLALIEQSYADRQVAGDTLSMGEVLVLDAHAICLANVVAQVFPGHAGSCPADSYANRRLALQAGLDYIIEHNPGTSLYVPYMLACGQSGDSWDKAIEPTLNALASPVYVCVPNWAESAAELAGRLPMLAPPKPSAMQVDEASAPLRSYSIGKPLA